MTTLFDVMMQAVELQGKGQVAEAEHLFKGILNIDPNNVVSLYSLGVISLNRGQADEALRLSAHGIAASTEFAPVRLIHGAALQAQERHEEALLSYEAAVRLNPSYTEALINGGVLLRSMLRHRDALEWFNNVLKYNPDNQIALANCGVILTEFKKSAEAIAMFRRLLTINSQYDYALGLYCMEKLHICDWAELDALTTTIVEGVRAGQRTVKTLALMAISDQVGDHYRAARIFAGQHFPVRDKRLWAGERYDHKRIRVAYVSPDLREHPVGHVMAGLIERHDKSRFEIIGISLGTDDQSRIRARMIAAFDRFVDARGMGTLQIAEMLRAMEVDIAVDLACFTADSGIGVFAYRPAPVQVNYLGYPGRFLQK